MAIFLAILLILIVMWPYIMRWLRPKIQNWFLGKVEDRMRAAAGMPSRKEEEKMRRKQKSSSRPGKSARRKDDRQAAKHRQGPIIPKEYAEDVEFTEIHTFEQTEITGTVTDAETGEQTVWHESQIEDAEYVEIKVKK